MTEIIAIVRRNRAFATAQELVRTGCLGYSRFAVLGRGRQQGLQDHAGDEGVTLLPKVLFELIVEDERVGEMVEAIIRANQTGQYGDGRIFLRDVADAYRISSGARESVGVVAEGME